MSFWALEQVAKDRAALIDAASGASVTYAGLLDRVAGVEATLHALGQRALGLILAENTIESISVYLASLRAGHPVILMDRALSPELVDRVVRTYQPRWIFCSGTPLELAGYERRQGAAGMLERRDTREIALHPDLALLLSTSGSTGSPKLVRLGHHNVASNARAIAEYLRLTAAERPITSLPMAYSYGLSIINSHLAMGATLVLTNRGVVEKDFWSAMARYECTSFAGVPYTYQMLLRFGLLKKSLPSSLKTLTQAGGRLDPSYIEQVRAIAGERGWSFYVMYGQTEASPRISYVPPADLHRKVGSIGVPVPGGSLEVDPDGELVYSGPNVMLGYAQCEADLCKGDELRGVLRTGDLGRRDDDGFFYVTGRRTRFLKMFGQRFSLDEIENELARRLHSPVACLGSDDQLSVFVEGAAEQASAARALVSELFAIHHSAFEVHALAALPLNPNRKTNYQALAELVKR